MRVLKRRPSGAMLVAFLALAVAIGGTASALPGKKSIDKNDLKKNVVKSSNVKNNVLTGDDVNEAALVGLLGNSLKVRKVTDADFDQGDVTVLTAQCQTGETLVSGGYRVPVTGAAGARPYVSQSAPVIAGSPTDTAAEGDLPNAWLVRGVNDSANDNQTLISFALCASLGS